MRVVVMTGRLGLEVRPRPGGCARVLIVRVRGRVGEGGEGSRLDGREYGSMLSCMTHSATDRRAKSRSTARRVEARSTLDPTTWMIRSGDIFRRSSRQQNSASRG